METVSVIIVNWNGGAALNDCLASIADCAAGHEPPEVLLVDNASRDGSQRRAAQQYPSVQVIQNAENVGFARAANQGIGLAHGELLVLMNPDVVLSACAIPLLTA